MDAHGNANIKIVSDQVISTGSFTVGENTFENLPVARRIAYEMRPGEGSFIRVELWLPQNWNGIFLGHGNGGLAGKIKHHNFLPYVSRGYAVAHTDMGTWRGLARGVDNPDVWRDFGWRSTYLMTVESKKMVRAHYGKDADFSYFIGASTGGQQAMCMAQRFPEEYDGIIAGVPGNNRVFLHTYFLWIHTHLRTRDGRVLFTPEQTEAITCAAADFFQSLGDGEPGDDFVTHPYVGKDTVVRFLEFLSHRLPLTDEQMAALKAVYDGPVNPKTGERIYSGMPIGSEMFGLFEAAQLPEGKNLYPFKWAFGSDYDIYTFDYADDLERIAKKLGPDMNANDPDLTAFCAHGGKLIAYSGSSDPYVPYPDFMKYYRRVCDIMGGVESVQKFFKYFVLPGKNHDADGKGVNKFGMDEGCTDVLEAIRLWREKGIEPRFMMGMRVLDGEVVFKRPVYPYSCDKREGYDCPDACDSRYLEK